MKQLVGADAVAPGCHQDAVPGLKALANHGELFLDAPAATPFLAEHFDMSIFAGSHKT